MKLLSYLRERLTESSTYAGAALAVTGAAALPSPYSWIAIALGVAGVLAPTKGNPQ